MKKFNTALQRGTQGDRKITRTVIKTFGFVFSSFPTAKIDHKVVVGYSLDFTLSQVVIFSS